MSVNEDVAYFDRWIDQAREESLMPAEVQCDCHEDMRDCDELCFASEVWR